MKLLLRLFDRIRPLFGEGRRLSPLKPAYDIPENIFFGPAARTASAPHVRDPLDIKRYMGTVIVALLPCLFAAVYFFGLRVLAMVVVSYAVGGTIEVLFAIVRKEEVNEGFLVTGLIFPLVLPPGLPFWAVAVGIAFGVIVGKELFGGTGRNPFNPALVGRCFLALSYAKVMVVSYFVPASLFVPGAGRWGNLGRYLSAGGVDAVSSATPLGALKVGGTFEPALNLFWGNISGSAAETSAVAIVAGGLFLVLTRVANWRTVAAVLGSFAGLGAVLHHALPGTFGPVGWHVLAGGLLFGAFFMATDPVTSPATNGGKWLYGIIIGAVTLLIRHLTGYVEGMMFAILLGNIAAPVLDEVVIRLHLRRLRHEGC